VVEHLPCKCENPSSKPSTTRNQKFSEEKTVEGFEQREAWFNKFRKDSGFKGEAGRAGTLWDLRGHCISSQLGSSSR
jgi:hypothetical protein